MIEKIYLSALRINGFRSMISIIYSFWLIKILRRKVRFAEVQSECISNETIESNLRIIDSSVVLPHHPTAKYFLGIGKNQGGLKSDMLINPIDAILSAMLQSKKNLKVLSVGPRSYGELLNLRAHGFDWENICGVDLFSIHEKVKVGDMHALPFIDNSFDILICGWVLAYSEKRELAASELARVLKPGGIFSIGVSFSSQTNEEQIKKRGYQIGSKDRIKNSEQILKYFHNSIGEVYFRVDPVANQAHSHILLTASISK